jgi:hypothetical protein
MNCFAILRGHLGYRFASTKQAGAMTDAFTRAFNQFDRAVADYPAQQKAA